jgi:hypothetical protein
MITDEQVRNTTGIGDKTTINCLQKALDETQETIRAYDTKAEVLAIILTLIVGVINFNLINEGCKAHSWIKSLSVVSIFLGISSLFAVGMALYPRNNLFKEIDTGNEKPKRTYYVSFSIMPSFKTLDEYLSQVDVTDWKREIAYEVLKTSCIRDNKHFWFHLALRSAAVTLLCIVGILIGVAYYG